MKGNLVLMWTNFKLECHSLVPILRSMEGLEIICDTILQSLFLVPGCPFVRSL